MKRILFYFVLISMLGVNTNVFAGILPGGIEGTIEIKYEDDRLDADRSLSKSKLILKRPLQVGILSFTPYVYFEDESYDSILPSASKKETDSAVGLDVVAFKNNSVKITLGTIYEYENNATGDDDGLLIFKLKVDF